MDELDQKGGAKGCTPAETNLKTLKEKVLHRQLLQPDGVDEKDHLEDDEAGQSGDEKGAATVAVGERAR